MKKHALAHKLFLGLFTFIITDHASRLSSGAQTESFIFRTKAPIFMASKRSPPGDANQTGSPPDSKARYSNFSKSLFTIGPSIKMPLSGRRFTPVSGEDISAARAIPKPMRQTSKSVTATLKLPIKYVIDTFDLPDCTAAFAALPASRRYTASDAGTRVPNHSNP